MIHHKYRIGKNYYGWFLAIPTWYGTFNVLEGLAKFDDAIQLFNEHRASYR